MKKYLFMILSLFVTHVAMGATAQVNSIVSLCSGALIFPDSNPSSYFCLHSVGGTVNTASPFSKNGVLYQTPTGTTHGFRVYCAVFSTPSAATGFQLLSQTSTFNVSAAVSGSVFQNSATTNYGHPAAVANTEYNIPIFYDFVGGVSAGTWPGHQNGAASDSIMACGKEF